MLFNAELLEGISVEEVYPVDCFAVHCFYLLCSFVVLIISHFWDVVNRFLQIL
jgi:hypothetical protein